MSSNQDDPKTPKPEGGTLIRFPVEKVRQKNRLKKMAGKIGDKTKTTLFLSLMSVLVMSFYLIQNSTQVERNIANTLDNRNFEAEEVLNKNLQDPNRRVPASYGRRPSAEEHLRMVGLNSGYALTFNVQDGLIIEVSYLEDGDGLNRPVFLQGGPSEFLLRYREAISPGFMDVRGGPETFELLDNESKVVGKATFEYFENKSLRSMKVQVFSVE